METEARVEIAEKIAEKMTGKVWTKNDIVRTYISGYIVIDEDGHANIDAVKRADYESVKEVCNELNITHYRA